MSPKNNPSQKKRSQIDQEQALVSEQDTVKLSEELRPRSFLSRNAEPVRLGIEFLKNYLPERIGTFDYDRPNISPNELQDVETIKRVPDLVYTAPQDVDGGSRHFEAAAI